MLKSFTVNATLKSSVSQPPPLPERKPTPDELAIAHLKWVQEFEAGVDDRRRAFGQALEIAIENSRLTKVSLAKSLDLNPSNLTRWTSGAQQPSMAKVFALEKHLEVKPGSLSVYLGYLPPEAGATAGSLHEMIQKSPELTERDSDLLGNLLDTLLGE